MLDKFLENVKKCSKFNFCSANVCPLDAEAGSKLRISDESRCPFCLNNKSKSQKGIRTLAPDTILEVVPESNIKMLNNRNQKAWLRLHGNGKR